jgi:hypothetical protein
VLLAALAGSARAEEPPAGATRETRRFALVIGNNTPPHPGLAPLHYADDDAVRWAVLFDALGGDVEVLTQLDAESARLYGPLAFHPTPPSREAVKAAVTLLAARVAAARAQGARTVFYFVYAGHGDVEDGQGYLALTDGRFTRADLGPSVLTPLGADTNHIIIDACRASSFLGNRGPGGERRPWQDAYFAPNAPRLPNTGFLLSSSSSGLSHEWEEFQAGVFSHEVRSGLMGAADANGDGVITYAELTGFVRLANLSVANERYRPRIVARTPAGGDAILVDLRSARAGSLSLGPVPSAAHEVLEDRAGVRWADFHPGAEARVRLILPRPSWNAEGFYLRSLSDESEYAIPSGRDVQLAALAPQPSRALRRGALTDAFTHLFELPFDQSALDHQAVELGIRADVDAGTPGTDLIARPRAAKKIAGIAGLLTGAAALGIAASLVVSALDIQHQAQQASGLERVRLDDQIDSRNHWAVATAVGGGVLVAAGLALLLWHNRGGEPPADLW